MKPLIYADHAATTPLSPKVLEAMTPYLTTHFGNPSSLHQAGQVARTAIETAREQVCNLLHAKKPTEITFTAGGTEADNLAIRGYMQGSKKKHIITTCIEHPALLETCEALEKSGCTVTYLPVDGTGMISLEGLEQAMTDDTALVSIMAANNEIGTLQPIAEIGALCHARGIVFHTDAVQAMGHIPIDVTEMHIDMLSLSAHKLHGPKGAGVLYVRTGVYVPAQITGGGQEKNRRSGTENVANIVGTATALSLAIEHMDHDMAYVKGLRDRLTEKVLTLPYSHFTGHPEKRLAGTASYIFEGIEGEGLLLLLDMHGICCSTGSACATGSLEPSHVLMSLGLPHAIVHGSLRVTLGVDNTEEQIDFIAEKIIASVERLRTMSPVWEKILKGEPIE
ncbi:MAG: cysteine desulfurase NifS [Eubacteriales bacterium]